MLKFLDNFDSITFQFVSHFMNISVNLKMQMSRIFMLTGGNFRRESGSLEG